MDSLRRLWLPLLAVSFLIPAQGTEVGEGVILGEGRQPVRGAKVHAELKGVPMAKAIRYVETDENGFFLIDQLEFGTYYVTAKKEEEGYRDSGFSFFTDQPVPTSQIFAQHRFPDVVTNLGPKAGILTGTISDAATGKRVEYDVECFPPIPVEGGVRILRFAGADVLETSSPMPEDAAERQYFYYAADGSERNLADYRNGNGMIWQEIPRLSWRDNENVFISRGD